MPKHGGKYGRGEPLIAFRLPPDEIAQVKTAAALQDATVSDLLRRLVRDHLVEVGVVKEGRVA